MIRAPYRAAAAAVHGDAPAFVHECGDILVRLEGPAGTSVVTLDSRTVILSHRPWLHDLSIPLYMVTFLIGACEAGTLMLWSRTIRGLPEGALRVLWLPAIVFAIATFGAFGPAARRVRIQGSTRGGQTVSATLEFANAASAKLFMDTARHAIQESGARKPPA